MLRKRPCLRALNLSLIVILSLMAVSVATAQAEGEWKIGGKTMKELGLKEESVSTKLVPSVKSVMSVPSLGVNWWCEVHEFTQHILLANGSLDTNVWQLLNCRGFTSGEKETEIKTCKVNSVGKAEGVIETKIGKGEVILSGGLNYLLLKPEKEIFSEIEVSGKECPIAGTYSVTGSMVFEIGSEAKELLLKAASLAGDGLKFGANKVTYQSLLAEELAGKNKGLAWTGF
jgi:hypothetical protein